MPASKKLVFSALLLIAGVIGYLIEIKTGREDLLGHLGALVVLLMVGLWALSLSLIHI